MEWSYEPETMYKAKVGTNRIYFMFSCRDGIKRVSVRRHDTDWCDYHIDTATEVNYYVLTGTWIMRIHVGCSPDWIFKSKKDGSLHRPTISSADSKEPKLKGRHYHAIIHDDMVDAATYAWKATTKDDVQKATEWYKGMKEKEVKKKMKNKSLFHVILFNRKIEEIEFDRILPAGDEQAAVMGAAQLFGKYDSKMHLTIVWRLQDSEYTTVD